MRDDVPRDAPSRRVNYDVVAPAFDQRYQRNSYDGIVETLRTVVGEAASCDALEIGCGTGHWLAAIADLARTRIGIEPSSGMLEQAREHVPDTLLARGTGEALPLRDACCDRVIVINVLHHATDKRALLREARRVLRPGGAILVVGLDPHTGTDRWWIYDYFPSAHSRDLARYPPAALLRELLNDVGFADARTFVCQHMPIALSYDAALERGVLDRRSTSQLMVITDEEFDAGRRRLDVERPVLSADLRLYATTARVR